ncbi:MAG: hypothetical protein RIQ32_831, partial [Actinomycetota bacterium]
MAPVKIRGFRVSVEGVSYWMKPRVFGEPFYVLAVLNLDDS